MKPITILIADDHTLVREAWSMVLNTDNRFQVIGGCGSAEEAIETAKRLRPDVLIMDISMPGMSGIEAIPYIRKYSPVTKILGVSVHSLPLYARKMIQEGATGYLSKHASREEMFSAILKVSRGEKVICNHIKEMIASQFAGEDDPLKKLASLSHRELQIISWIKDGFISKEIAARLSISVKTVEAHRYNILRKLGLKNSVELVCFMTKYLPGL
jgi:DNA-binding NarL/FixJ family response regulator